MKVDELLLMAYVDGALSTRQCAEVEAAVAGSAELSSQVEALRAARLPYQAAFEQQPLPPVPDRLSNRIAELVAQSASQKPRFALRARSPVWLSAAFFAGVICSGLVFSVMSDLSPSRSAPVPWVQAVADYQGMYVRATVAHVVEDRDITRQVVLDIRRRDGIPVRIPDLHRHGLTFKHIQRLSFHGKPLIQIVYLPEQGDPVALCVLPQARDDEAVNVKRVGEMDTVSWRQNHLAYVLLAKNPSLDLRQLGQLIAEQRERDLI